jgi:hypothetical protein
LSGRVAELRTEYRGPARVTPLKDASSDEAEEIYAEDELVAQKNAVAEKVAVNTFQQQQIEMIRGAVVRERVLAKEEIARLTQNQQVEDIDEWFAERLIVEPVEDDRELVTVSFVGADARSSALITNAIVEAYFKTQAHDEAYRTQRMRELLVAEVKRREARIKILDANLRHGIVEYERRFPGQPY